MAIEDILKRIANGEWLQPAEQPQPPPAQCFDQTRTPFTPYEAAGPSTAQEAGHSNSEYEARAEDPYWQAVIEAQRRLRRLNWPPNLRVWLDACHPAIHRKLYEDLPGRIDRLWDLRAPLLEFERVLDEWVNAHQEACSLWEAECNKHRGEEL